MPEIDYAFLADFAKIDVASGTLTSVGASWTYVKTPGFPVAHQLAIAGRVRALVEDGDVPIRVTISGPPDTFKTSAEGLLSAGASPRPYGDGVLGHLFAFNTQVPLMLAGLYEVTIDVLDDDGASVASRTLRFEAELIVPAAE